MSPDLRRRIAFTLGALLIYCFGTYIPVPGIDGAVWDWFLRPLDRGMFSRDGTHGPATFALNVTPGTVIEPSQQHGGRRQ